MVNHKASFLYFLSKISYFPQFSEEKKNTFKKAQQNLTSGGKNIF